MRVLSSSSTLLFSLLSRRQEQRMKCVRWVCVYNVKRVYRGTVQSQREENWLHRDILFFFLLLHMWHSIDEEKKRRTTKARETDARFKRDARRKEGNIEVSESSPGMCAWKVAKREENCAGFVRFRGKCAGLVFFSTSFVSPETLSSKFKAKRSL